MKVPKLKITGTNAVNLAGAVIIIYLVILLGQTIKNNYDLGQQITGLKGQITLLQAQKDSLSDNVQYDETSSAMDLAARSELDLQLPSEHVIIIPNDSPSPTPTLSTVSAQPAMPTSNFQQWIDFLSGRD